MTEKETLAARGFGFEFEDHLGRLAVGRLDDFLADRD